MKAMSFHVSHATKSAWRLVVLSSIGLALAACSGSDGADGADGAQGPPGENGIDGNNGVDGNNGLDGANGEDGLDGSNGEPGTSTGTVEGTVTNALTGDGMDAVMVAFDFPVDPAVETDADGEFSVELPIGQYTVTFDVDGYETSTWSFSLRAGEVVDASAALEPSDAVAVRGTDTDSEPGGTATLEVLVESFDGSTVASYEWQQIAGVTASLDDDAAASPTATFPEMQDYKDLLFGELRLPDRAQLVGVNPFALEETELAVFEVTVTMDDDSVYLGEVEVHVDTALRPTTGNHWQPVDVPVLFQAPAIEGTYDWEITSSPDDSTATLDDATSRWPVLLTDEVGHYTVIENETESEFDIAAGVFVGAITGVGEDGLPESAGCTNSVCHSAEGSGPDMFPDWKQTGHATTFMDYIDSPSHHFSSRCASCHGTGYDPEGENFGWDEAWEAEEFSVPSGGPGTYDGLFDTHPETAALGNVQCESCHGPNETGEAHVDGESESRVSYNAQLCGSCHGEPARHARYQQWQESGHGNYDLALSRGSSSNCARCHTAQGFVQWIDQMEETGDYFASLDEDRMWWDPEDTEPIACAACHDPHKQGRTSGEPNTATVRVTNSTYPTLAGYQATGVGRGALCITCHNTRRGERSDFIDLSGYNSPHGGAQGDVLMGESAFFMGAAQRSPHSFIRDSCANCHMEQTPPPAELSHNLSGTNHTFEATMAICGNCHGDFTGEGLQAATEASLHLLGERLSETVVDVLEANGPTFFANDTLYNQDVNAVAGVHLITSHGQMEFDIVFADDSEIEVRMGDLEVDDDGEPGGAFFSLEGNFVRAAWNMFLLETDGSLGVHNPSWTADVISTTLRQDISDGWLP